MPFEQTTKFQVKGPGPFGRTCTSITGKLHDETKIPRNIFEKIIIYC